MTSKNRLYLYLPRQMLADTFTDRELQLLANAYGYAEDDPAGLPDHNLMIIIHKLCQLIGFDRDDVLGAVAFRDEHAKKAPPL